MLAGALSLTSVALAVTALVSRQRSVGVDEMSSLLMPDTCLSAGKP